MAKKNNNLNLNSLTSQLDTTSEISPKIQEVVDLKNNVKTLSSQSVKTLKTAKKTIKQRKTIYLEKSNLDIIRKLEFENGKDMSFNVNQIIMEWSQKNNNNK